MSKTLRRMFKKVGEKINAMAMPGRKSDGSCIECGYPVTRAMGCGKCVPVDSELQRAIEVLQKWSVAMAQRWNDLRKKMEDVGLHRPDSLIIDDVAYIREGQGSMLMIVVNGRGVYPYLAVLNPLFDIGTLGEIRRKTMEAFKAFDQQIEDAKNKLKTGAAEREEKLKTILPAVIDDFGADVLMYGELRKPMEGPSAAAPAYSFGADPGGGLFPAPAGELKIATGGAEILELRAIADGVPVSGPHVTIHPDALPRFMQAKITHSGGDQAAAPNKKQNPDPPIQYTAETF